MLTDDQHLFSFCEGGSEDIVVATLTYFQTFAEIGNGHGEVAHGDIRLTDILQGLLQVLLVHRGDSGDAELASREICYGLL